MREELEGCLTALVVTIILSVIVGFAVYEARYQASLEWSEKWEPVTVISKQYTPERVVDDSGFKSVYNFESGEYETKYVIDHDHYPERFDITFQNEELETFSYNDRELFNRFNFRDKCQQLVRYGYDVKKEKVTRVNHTSTYTLRSL